MDSAVLLTHRTSRNLLATLTCAITFCIGLHQRIDGKHISGRILVVVLEQEVVAFIGL